MKKFKVIKEILPCAYSQEIEADSEKDAQNIAEDLGNWEPYGCCDYEEDIKVEEIKEV